MISPETFDFLARLKENNHRDWFLSKKADYENARENLIAFTSAVLKKLAQYDTRVSPDTDAKKCVMRIYRDIRFSKDKTPYKSYFGVHKFTSGYGGGVGYYMHVEPGRSFIGGGYWQPEGEHLKAIRQEIDYNAEDLKAIIDTLAFKKLFGDFRDQERLKTVPAGYEVNNPNMSLLKLKSFAAVHSVKNAELQKPDAAVRVAEVLKEIIPLQLFIHQALQS